jgi:hypothetical protein
VTPRQRRKLAEHLAVYVFHALGGPDRIAGKFKAEGTARTVMDRKGEVEGAGFSQGPLADHLEAELGRYVSAERRAIGGPGPGDRPQKKPPGALYRRNGGKWVVRK